MSKQPGMFLKGTIRRASGAGPEVHLFGFIIDGIEEDRICAELWREQASETLLRELRAHSASTWIRVPYAVGDQGQRYWAIESIGRSRSHPFRLVRDGDVDAVRVVRAAPLVLELKLKDEAAVAEVMALLNS